MENKNPSPAPKTVACTDVVTLRCPERLQFDAVPLQRLLASKSSQEADDILCRVLADLSMRLGVLQKGLDAGNHALILKPCRKVRLVAEQIGLTEVAIAADHVQTCLRNADNTALAATMARLERAFDVAVTEVWKFRQS